jgi:hypothetical protein
LRQIPAFPERYLYDTENNGHPDTRVAILLKRRFDPNKQTPKGVVVTLYFVKQLPRHRSLRLIFLEQSRLPLEEQPALPVLWSLQGLQNGLRNRVGHYGGNTDADEIRDHEAMV